MELLLSYIEFQQFEDYVKSHLDDKDESEIKTIPVPILTLPESVPSSEVFDADNDVHTKTDESDDKDWILCDAKIKAHRIFNKYIKCGCQYEINIQYQQRQQLSVILGDLDTLKANNVTLKDLKSIFSECKTEMVTLLTWSLSRFKSKKEFQGIKDMVMKDRRLPHVVNHQVSISLNIEKD